MSTKMTFKRLCDAAVTMGEMDQGTAGYFHGLFLNSDEHRDAEDGAKLRTALGDLVDAVNVEFPGGINIGGKTGLALIQAVNALAKPPFDVAEVTEAQTHNHEKPLQLD